MKKLFLILFAGAMLLSLTCGGDTEADITINLTNPQDKAVKYNGYYVLSATGDTTTMAGYTPGEYTFTLEKGDGASGRVYKDTVDIVDTLSFQLLLDGATQLDTIVTIPGVIIQFAVTAQ